MRWLKKSSEPKQGARIDIARLQRELGIRIGERGNSTLTLACEEMSRTNHHELGAEHLIVGVLEEGGPAALLLLNHGITLEGARAQIAEALWEADEPLEYVDLTAEASNILATAAEAAGMRGHPAIEPEHITYGFVCSGFEITSRVLHMIGVDRQKLLQDSEQLLSNGH
ncbi:MAG: Clp protease N-terminal domain-containing protein [Gaiellaceae bacterium]